MTGEGAILIGAGHKPIRGSALEVGADREHTPVRVADGGSRSLSKIDVT